MKLFWMMLAGALGVAARYGLTIGVQRWMATRGAQLPVFSALGTSFPLGTLVINILGSFLLAFLTTLVLQGAVRPEWRLILGTGFLGAFTTFSTFELETEELLSRGAKSAAAVYVFGSLFLSFASIFLGRWSALRFLNMFTGSHAHE
jgi:CrcB protein